MWETNLRAAAPDTSVFVAKDTGGQIIGFTACGPERTGDPLYRGELHAIYLLESHQRQGIGRDLFATAVDRLVEQQMDSMLLWVLAAILLAVSMRRCADTSCGSRTSRLGVPH